MNWDSILGWSSKLEGHLNQGDNMPHGREREINETAGIMTTAECRSLWEMHDADIFVE